MHNRFALRWSALLLVLVFLVAACTEPEDAVPNAFSFAPIMGAEPGAEVTSDPATISGINVAVPASVTPGATLLVNGEETTSPTTVRRGDTVAVTVVSSTQSEGSVSATVTVGGVEADFVVTTRTLDTEAPDVFSFAPVTDADPGVEVTSEAVSISGITTMVPASVSEGAVLIVNGAEIASPTMVRAGDEVAVRVVSSAEAGGTATATVTVGGVSADFVVTTREASDGGVEPFSFPAVTDADPGVVVTSGPVVIAGAPEPVTASITAGDGVLVVNGADSGTSAEVANGDTLAVRVVSSADAGGTVTVTVQVGDETADFVVTTRAEPGETPDPFSFDPVTGAAPGEAVTSAEVMITGIDVPVTATVSPGGELVINGAASGDTAEVNAGDRLAVTVTSSMVAGQTVTVTVTVGGGSATFSVTTGTAPEVTLTSASAQATPDEEIVLSWTVDEALDLLELTSSDGLELDVSGETSRTVTIPGNRPTVTYTLTGTSSTNPAVTASATTSIDVPLWVCEVPTDVITFADAELEGYFRELPEIPDTGDLTCADARSVTVFETPTWQDEPGTASSLVGMQHLINLETFWAEFNDFEDLTPLAGLTGLQVLQLDGNRVTDLSPIAGLTELRLLGLWDNGPVRLDYDAGVDVDLMCRDGISDISPLAGMVNMEVLFLSCNSVADLSPVENMTNLQMVFFIGNLVTSIEPLEGLANLQALRFSDNQVASDEGVLATLTGLRWLEMAYNQLEDDSLASLETLPNLFALDLEGNYFTNMDPILANMDAPASEGTGDDQEPAVATVSLGYNCILPEDPVLATVQANLEVQGFAVVGGFDEPGAVQRDVEDCTGIDPAGFGALSSPAAERQLQLYRDRTGMR